MVYIVLAMLVITQLAASITSAETSSAAAMMLAKEVNISNILHHVNNIVDLGGRVTGYEGCYKVRDYILDTLREYNIQVTLQNYRVIVPIDEGSSIVVLGGGGNRSEELPAYALWPNGINPSFTPPEGVTGRLVYVGSGKLESFDGKDVKGAIVIMDYDSYDNWLNAVKLGAKAVIFVEPNDVPMYFDNLKKFLDAPINFPRLYVSKSVGEKLKSLSERNYTVTVHVNIRWKEVEAQNIIGVIRGVDTVGTILLTTHYDSWSAVPGLASSAHEALSTAYLLELARVLAANEVKPRRTVWLVFFSGYWQALAGPKAFVERYYFGPEVSEGAFQPLMLINIGFLDPNGLGLQLLRGGAGTFYGTTSNMGGIALRYSWVLRKINDYLGDATFRSEFINAYGVEPTTYVRDYFTNSMYWGTEAFPYMLASEPAEMTGGVAFTVQTMYASKQWLGSPVNDFHLVKSSIEKLEPQLLATTYLVLSFTSEKDWGVRWSEVAPTRARIIGPSYQYGGFITLKGKVLVYNLSIGWYTPLPNALVRVYVGFFTGNGYIAPPYPFNKVLIVADDKGEFEVNGLLPYPLLPGVGAAGGGLARAMYVMEAWKLDERSEIAYAPDFGLYGAKAIPPVISPLSPVEEASVVVGRFNAVTLLDLFNPKDGRPAIIPDPRTASFGDYFTSFFSVGGGLQVLDFDMRGEPLFYGVYFNGYEPVGLAFFPPGSKAAVLFRSGGLAQPVAVRPIAIVVNASALSPEGSGIHHRYLLSAVDYARDLIFTAKNRYERLTGHGVRSSSVEEKLDLAERLFNASVKLLLEKKYSEAYSLAITSWALSQRGYEEVMSLIEDSSRTSLFFYALIIFSALFTERLIVHKEGKTRIFSTLAIGSCLVAFFALSHPALHIMVNSFMALIGIVAFSLFMMTVGTLSDEARQSLREISYGLLGMHEVEMRRLPIAMSSFAIALENMRRRKVRALLTILTFISIALSITALTSVSPHETLKEVGLPRTPYYSGMLMKNGFGVPPIGVYHPMIVDVVEDLTRIAEPSGHVIVLPRAWYYPQSVGPALGVAAFVAREQEIARNVSYRIVAAMGMVSVDVERTLGRYLLPGSRSFFENEMFSCIIPDTVARRLGVEIGDRIVFQGLRLLVVGIYDTSLLGASDPRELDGYPVIPVDPHYVSQLGLGVLVPAQQAPPPLAWTQIIIVPFELAIKLGGYVSMISLIPSAEGIAFYDLAGLLSYIFDIPVTVSDGQRVVALSRYYFFTAIGWEAIPVVVAIGALNAVVALLGNFKERLRETSTYAALGLNPLGAAIMYITESLTYAVLSITFGYFLGFLLNNLFIKANLLPEQFTFNYASIFVMLSTVVLLLMAFASSLYIAANAATIITPSLERKWKPPTKPRKGSWEVPMPISLPSREEALGLIAFLKEYYIGAGAERAAFSVRDLKVSYEELGIRLRVALAPYELGILQNVDISAIYSEREKKFIVLTKMVHEAGNERMWEKLSLFFLDDLRKQLLLWRALSIEEHRKYTEVAFKEMAY